MDVLLYAAFSRDAAIRIAYLDDYNPAAAMTVIGLLAVAFWLYRTNLARSPETESASWDALRLVVIGAIVLGPVWVLSSVFLASRIAPVSWAASSRLLALSSPFGMVTLLAAPYNRTRPLLLLGIVHQTAVFGLGLATATNSSFAIGLLLSLGSVIAAHLAAPLIFGLLILTRTPIPVFPWLNRMPFAGRLEAIAGDSWRSLT